jgi:hypothetical protein
MRMRTELWQGHFGYWQNRFIHHNILMIGYTAWVGYMTQGRGMVVCDVVDAVPPSIDWSVDAVAFRRTFIPSAQVTTYLHSLALMQEAGVALLNAIATYDPTHAMVVLVMGNGAVDINLLQNMAIAPADCYTQVQQRWAEFQPDLTTPRKHS